MSSNKYDAQMGAIGHRLVHADKRISPTNADFEALEKRIAYAVPPDYKEFLLKFGVTASDEEPWIIRAGSGADDGGVDVFLGFAPGSSYDLGKYINRFERDDLPPRVLPIARSSGGSLIVMSLAGDDARSVYWWHPEDPFGGETTELIAKDFDAFLHALVRG